MKLSTALTVWAGLTSGNFLHAAVKSNDWDGAGDRSFFMLVAVLCCWLAARHSTLPAPTREDAAPSQTTVAPGPTVLESDSSMDSRKEFPPAGLLPTEKAVREFCERRKIVELSLFGSIIRDDARPDSDVDVLVTFEEDPQIDLYDLVDIQEELEAMFGRRVDLVMKSGLRNPFRRHEILRTHKVIYAATPS